MTSSPRATMLPTMNPPKKPSRLKLMPAGERAHRRPAERRAKPVLRPLLRPATP